LVASSTVSYRELIVGKRRGKGKAQQNTNHGCQVGKLVTVWVRLAFLDFQVKLEQALEFDVCLNEKVGSILEEKTEKGLIDRSDKGPI